MKLKGGGGITFQTNLTQANHLCYRNHIYIYIMCSTFEALAVITDH
jgi:hypothetical protein